MKETAVPELVQRLLAHEAEYAPNEQADGPAVVEAVGHVCEKLRIHLSKRIGLDGFRTLLARALHLATAQFPHLSTVRVAPDGTLQGLREVGTTAEGAGALVTHLLELLVTFIGYDLTRRILSTVWPQMSLLEENEAAGMDTDNNGNTGGSEVEKR